MNTRETMVIIKNQIKTSEIISCQYREDTKRIDVQFKNGRTYSYAYSNVKYLKDPESLNPNQYHISRADHEFFDVAAILVFRDEGTKESYWHICFGNGMERDYRESDLKIVENCLSQKQSADVLGYLKQIARLSDIKNKNTGERLLAKRFEKISFIDEKTALAKYLDPGAMKQRKTAEEYVPIFSFGCNNSQYEAVKKAIENQIGVIQGTRLEPGKPRPY